MKHLIENRPQPSPHPPPPKRQTLKRLLSFLLFLCVGAGIAVSALAAISHIPASDEILFGISFLTAGVSAMLILL